MPLRRAQSPRRLQILNGETLFLPPEVCNRMVGLITPGEQTHGGLDFQLRVAFLCHPRAVELHDIHPAAIQPARPDHELIHGAEEAEHACTGMTTDEIPDDAPQLALDLGAELGEGPMWDAAAQRLLFVDIKACTVYRLDPADGELGARQFTQQVGAVVPRASGGLLLALQDGFWTVDALDGQPQMLAEVEAANSATRMNDGKCDRAGRFWAGTMGLDAARGAGSLYRLDVDGTVTRMLDGVTISNGLGWSPDNRTMYYIDTMTHGVDAFDYDIGCGAITNRRRLVSIPEPVGLPDGLAVDADGYIWVALAFGWGINRYTPAGVLDREVRLPVALATSCAFAGPTLSHLYITTGWTGLTDAERAAQPLAGGLFRARPGVRGLPEVPFAG